ncbi:Ribosomal L1 domain-containing protein 1 [Dinochytrium kinnereticum]|nr:Ribosomal L1 domain-containing protein 1 [Dinochytrium kinnereticum]
MELDALYTYFMADGRIMHLLPTLLGGKIFKKKHPTTLDFTQKDLNQEIESAKSSTYLQLNSGLCIAVKIATTSFTRTEITENILYSTDPIISLIPKKWRNIRSIHLKTNDSAALPVWPLNEAEDQENVTVTAYDEPKVAVGGKRRLEEPVDLEETLGSRAVAAERKVKKMKANK